jgi:hypothetical protein
MIDADQELSLAHGHQALRWALTAVHFLHEEYYLLAVIWQLQITL